MCDTSSMNDACTADALSIQLAAFGRRQRSRQDDSYSAPVLDNSSATSQLDESLASASIRRVSHSNSAVIQRCLWNSRELPCSSPTAVKETDPGRDTGTSSHAGRSDVTTQVMQCWESGSLRTPTGSGIPCKSAAGALEGEQSLKPQQSVGATLSSSPRNEGDTLEPLNQVPGTLKPMPKWAALGAPGQRRLNAPSGRQPDAAELTGGLNSAHLGPQMSFEGTYQREYSFGFLLDMDSVSDESQRDQKPSRGNGGGGDPTPIDCEGSHSRVEASLSVALNPRDTASPFALSSEGKRLSAVSPSLSESPCKPNSVNAASGARPRSGLGGSTEEKQAREVSSTLSPHPPTYALHADSSLPESLCYTFSEFEAYLAEVPATSMPEAHPTVEAPQNSSTGRRSPVPELVFPVLNFDDYVLGSDGMSLPAALSTTWQRTVPRRVLALESVLKDDFETSTSEFAPGYVNRLVLLQNDMPATDKSAAFRALDNHTLVVPARADSVPPVSYTIDELVQSDAGNDLPNGEVSGFWGERSVDLVAERGEGLDQSDMVTVLHPAAGWVGRSHLVEHVIEEVLRGHNGTVVLAHMPVQDSPSSTSPRTNLLAMLFGAVECLVERLNDQRSSGSLASFAAAVSVARMTACGAECADLLWDSGEGGESSSVAPTVIGWSPLLGYCFPSLAQYPLASAQLCMPMFQRAAGIAEDSPSDWLCVQLLVEQVLPDGGATVLSSFLGFVAGEDMLCGAESDDESRAPDSSGRHSQSQWPAPTVTGAHSVRSPPPQGPAESVSRDGKATDASAQATLRAAGKFLGKIPQIIRLSLLSDANSVFGVLCADACASISGVLASLVALGSLAKPLPSTGNVHRLVKYWKSRVAVTGADGAHDGSVDDKCTHGGLPIETLLTDCELFLEKAGETWSAMYLVAPPATCADDGFTAPSQTGLSAARGASGGVGDEEEESGSDDLQTSCDGATNYYTQGGTSDGWSVVVRRTKRAARRSKRSTTFANITTMCLPGLLPPSSTVLTESLRTADDTSVFGEDQPHSLRATAKAPSVKADAVTPEGDGAIKVPPKAEPPQAAALEGASGRCERTHVVSAERPQATQRMECGEKSYPPTTGRDAVSAPPRDAQPKMDMTMTTWGADVQDGSVSQIMMTRPGGLEAKGATATPEPQQAGEPMLTTGSSFTAGSPRTSRSTEVVGSALDPQTLRDDPDAAGSHREAAPMPDTCGRPTEAPQVPRSRGASAEPSARVRTVIVLDPANPSPSQSPGCAAEGAAEVPAPDGRAGSTWDVSAEGTSVILRREEEEYHFDADEVLVAPEGDGAAGHSKRRLAMEGRGPPQEATQTVQSTTVNELKSLFCEGYNVALLGADMDASVPFADQPALSMFKSSVVDSIRELRVGGPPCEVTLYVSLIKGMQLMADLLSPLPTVPRPVAVVSSPLFGPLISGTTGVPCYDPMTLHIIMARALAKADSLKIRGGMVVAVAVLKREQPEDEDVITASFFASCTTDGLAAYQEVVDGGRGPSQLFRFALGGPSTMAYVVRLRGRGREGHATSPVEMVGTLRVLCGVSNYVAHRGSVRALLEVTNETLRVHHTRRLQSGDPVERRRLDGVIKRMQDVVEDHTLLLADPMSYDAKVYPPELPRAAGTATPPTTGLIAPAPMDFGGQLRIQRLAIVTPCDAEEPNATRITILPKGTTGLTLIQNDFPVSFNAEEVITNVGNAAFSQSKLLKQLTTSFVDGYNVSLLTADGRHSASALTAIRRVAHGAMRRATETSEVFLSVASVVGQTACDLLREGAERCSLTVSSSPLLGPCIQIAKFVPVTTPVDFDNLMRGAMLRCSDENPLLVVNCVLKQIRPDDDDVLVSSFFATLVGTNFTVYADIFDEETSFEMRELFRFALGGPCHTVVAFGITEDDENPIEMLSLQGKLGAVRGLPPRYGSVRSFITTLQGCVGEMNSEIREQVRTAMESRRKRMIKTIRDFEAFLASPVGTLPPVYPRRRSSTSQEA